MSSSLSLQFKYMIFHSCIFTCILHQVVHNQELEGVTMLYSWTRHFLSQCVPPHLHWNRFSVPTSCKSNITKYLAVACSRLETYPWEEAIIRLLFIFSQRDKLQLCGQFGLSSWDRCCCNKIYLLHFLSITSFQFGGSSYQEVQQTSVWCEVLPGIECYGERKFLSFQKFPCIK